MADDLAAQLARALTLAMGRMLPTSGYQPSKVTELLAADLRQILPALTTTAYDAGRRDEWIDGFGTPSAGEPCRGTGAPPSRLISRMREPIRGFCGTCEVELKLLSNGNVPSHPAGAGR